MKERTSTKIIRADRDESARRALDAIERAQASLGSAAIEIMNAVDWKQAHGDFMLPSADALQRAVAEAARYRALWAVVGEIEREEGCAAAYAVNRDGSYQMECPVHGITRWETMTDAKIAAEEHRDGEKAGAGEDVLACPDCHGMNTSHADEAGHMHDCHDCGAAWNPDYKAEEAGQAT